LTVTQDAISKKINKQIGLRKTEQDQLDKSSEKVKSYQDALNRGSDQTKVIEEMIATQQSLLTANDRSKSSLMELQKVEELLLFTRNKASPVEYAKLENTWDQNIANQRLIEDKKIQLTLDQEALRISAAKDKREAARFQIEKAQAAQLKGRSGASVENGLFTRNMKLLNDQLAQLGDEKLTEKQRINDLIEQEVARHNSKMEELNAGSFQAAVDTFAMGSQQVTSLADLMTNGVKQVEDSTAEMNAGQKAAFILMQGVAATMAIINGISLGMSLAKNFGILDPTLAAASGYATFGTALGVAQGSAIMATTFAGAFDKGGTIPSGQMGIVSEYGDELVNGQLIKGPAKVTSREDTAKMMNGGGNTTKIIIENKIDGANYTTQQIDENTVKVIAEKVFSDNIDSGVSSVVSNRNSKATKAMKSKFNVRSNY
jgi:hypothetical protein